MTAHIRTDFAPTRSDDERVLLVLEMRRAGYKSRSIAALSGFKAEYCRTIAQRVAEHDINHSKGRDRQAARRFWGQA